MPEYVKDNGYKCEYCKRLYEQWDDARDCEIRHTRTYFDNVKQTSGLDYSDSEWWW